MLVISLLGEQRVVAGGAPLRNLPPRTLELLGFLVLHPGAPQLRGHVAGVFWPDSSEEQARTNLRRELHQLRRALPEPDRCLTVDASSLCWRPDAAATVDVVDFERAATDAERAQQLGDDDASVAAADRAVRSYGGSFMPGYYDDWILAERQRLQRRCLGLLDRLVERAAERGDVSEAVAYAHRRLELEPLEEAGYLSLMRLEVEAGDRGAALRTFHRCATVLERELGLTPSEDVVALHRRLQGGGRHEAVPAAGDRPGVALVGREEELDRLRAAWSGPAGRGRLLLVSGVAGVGKTRLVEELATEVEDGGGAVARARCHPSSERLALAPVVEWLRSRAVRDGVDHLDERWRAELARLRPELCTGQPPPVEPAGPWQRQRLFDAVVRAVLAPRRPVLMVLDDLHWSDRETLDLIAHLLRVGHEPPVTVVATMRTDAPADPPGIHSRLTDCAAEGLIAEERLSPLSPADTARLVVALGRDQPGPAELQRLQARTGGLPLLLVESLRGGDGPSRAGAVLTQRLGSLSPTAREVCELIAVAGRAVSLAVLAAASGLDTETVVAAVEELWAAQLLREEPTASYELAHDLLRDAVRGSLSPPRRQQRHRAMAAALEDLHADDLRPVAGELADHHRRAGQLDRAIEHHWLAAQASAEVFAHAAAVHHQQEAIASLDELQEHESPRRADALARLGAAQRSAGDPGHLRTLLDAAAMARRHGDGALLARSILAASDDGYWSSSFAADPERAGLVRAALDLVPGEAAIERAALCARLAIEQQLVGEHADAAALVDESERLARQAGEPASLLDALAARTFLCQDPDSIRTAHEVAGTCVDLAAQLGDRVRLIHELLKWDSQLRKVGRVAEADLALERAGALAARVDHPPTRYWIANGLLVAALTAGDARSAQELVDRTVAIGEEIGFPDARRRALYASYAIHLLRGSLAEFAPGADALIAPRYRLPALEAARALVLAHAGQPAEARRTLHTLTDGLDDLPPLSNPHVTVGLLARVAHRLDDGDAAEQVLERLRPAAGLVLIVGGAVLGTTDHTLGLAAAAAGRADEATEHLHRAIDLERSAGMHGWLAHTEAALAHLAPALRP